MLEPLVEKARREGLKAKRNMLFQEYLKSPRNTRLALEIKLIDDDCEVGRERDSCESKQRQMRVFIFRLFRPLFRRKLRKLEGFSGPESYADQMRRRRLIATLKACLMY